MTMPQLMQVTTIGFTQKSAERFFTLLKEADVKTVLDVRLNNTSQLAGFSKKPDLEFFLSSMFDINYIDLRELTPERDHLKRYQSGDMSWDDYASAYIEVLAKRRVESNLDITVFNGACLLCSEHTPDRCHRRLALEYLNSRWSNRLTIRHLL
ncbi:hypothetical protein ASG35_18815 [Burkholderia sp. Leaf177]|uniref:DUF488 domain-containing protein n=1 Tax=Burkholderia sp. Leaf177 TaxID=1736287 RepID=UPI0006F51064|nr:DUF488 domain-containing protein [Burkholderia sp. Leaf177]KQR74769.1 hypothetical protein ASG35_18815 [Burkholderia sp. Leaf177]